MDLAHQVQEEDLLEEQGQELVGPLQVHQVVQDQELELLLLEDHLALPLEHPELLKR